MGLDATLFAAKLNGVEVQQSLQENLALAAILPINGFPSLVLQKNNKHIPIQINYTDAKVVLDQLYVNWK